MTFVDQTDTAVAVEAVAGADLVWAETPNNPLLGITDLEALAGAAQAAGARLAVDATLATPLLQRSLELGADLVVHSATKYLAGHADALLGVIVAAEGAEREALARRRELTGAIPGPFETYLGVRGIRTLPLRVERAQENAGELARRLAGHPAIASLRYPGLAGHPGHELAARQMDGFGAMLAFELIGGVEAADVVCANVRLIANATSLGGVETLIERRGRYPDEGARAGRTCSGSPSAASTSTTSGPTSSGRWPPPRATGRRPSGRPRGRRTRLGVELRETLGLGLDRAAIGALQAGEGRQLDPALLVAPRARRPGRRRGRWRRTGASWW